ncbi:MAG: hypothetical protein F4Z87_00115, partial [Gammaproteobacteria bacterium]|nr:hypothetical protein [Gammaproteobacteria bacterium]
MQGSKAIYVYKDKIYSTCVLRITHMKKSVIFVVSLLLVTAATLQAQRSSSNSWAGYSLNQLETFSSSVFELLDSDKNGSITLDEIDLLKEEPEEPLSEEELALQRRRMNLISSYFWTEEEINTFEVADTNGDGSMDRAEYDNLESSVRTRILELGIESLDTDKNGSVEVKEFSAHLESFEEWDNDGNGTIDRAEMREISDRRFHTDIRSRWSAGDDLGGEARRRFVLES